MADLTSVGVTSGVPSSGTGTVATINQLIIVGSPISNGSTSAPVIASLVGPSSAVTSSMTGLASALSYISSAATLQSVASLSSGTVFVSSGSLATVGTINSISSGTISLSSNSPGIIPLGTAGVGSTLFLSVQGASNATPIPISGSVSLSSIVSVYLSSVGWGGTNSSLSTPVVPADQYGQYTVVAASNTQLSLGSSAGRVGDYLAYLTVFPTVAASGSLTIFDSTTTTIGSFVGGGTTALPSLVPFRIDIGAYSASSGWKVTTSSNISAVAIGKFT